jgi:hypothetical protein
VAKSKNPAQESKRSHTKNFTLRDVIKHTHKDDIHSIVSEVTDAQPGHKDWLRHYPAALTQVIENLSEDERIEAEKILDQWTDDGVPREVQRMWVFPRIVVPNPDSSFSNAEKFLAEDIRSFLKDIQKRTGAQLFVMAGFERACGTAAIAKYLTF